MITKTDKLSPESKILIGTIGLPYSGKTTWALSNEYPIICPDSIRIALHGQRFIKEAEEFVWAICRVMVKSLFMSGHNRVILDACNIKKENRQKWECNLWETRWHYINTTKEECIKRALEAYDTEIIPIIEKMNSEMELPTYVWPTYV